MSSLYLLRRRASWLACVLCCLSLSACPAEGDGDGDGQVDANNGENNGVNNGVNNGENNGENNGPECVGDGDCAGGEVCQEGVCAPLAEGCEEDRDCRGGEVCQEGVCVAIECVEDGDCEDGEVCRGGQCEAAGCAPGATRCDAGALLRCGEDGVERPESCEPGSSCQETDSGAECVFDPECEAGSGGCEDEDTAWACEEGARVSRDCGEGELCQEGQCAPRSCAPFEIGCLSARSAFVCDEEGVLTALPCREGQVCQDAACVEQACEPGAVSCEGETLLRCNEGGTLLEALDCADAEGCADNPLGCACAEGACQARVCAPGAARCEGGAPEVCAEDGLSWEQGEPCGERQLCLEGECLDAECQPGAVACVGDALVGCGEGGLLELMADCGAQGERCDALALECVARDCEPGVGRCEGDVAYVCNPETLQEDSRVCGEGTRCVAGACEAPVCVPGEASCQGAVVRTCNEDGSGFEDVGVDCALAGLRCQAGLCVGGENQCPVVVARGGQPAAGVSLRSGRVVLPAGAALALDGSASTDDDTVSRVSWRLVTGASAQIQAGADPRNATVTGLQPMQRYVFEATAYDSAEVPSCEVETLEVYTAAEGAAVFHLVWDNANDPNPLDTAGSDVDLRLLRSGAGRWMSSPDDIHFANPEPAWAGGAGSGLLLDDVNGRGPEIIVVQEPQECMWYHLGLHYYRADMGRMTAQVHVFFEGQLAYELETEALQQSDQWMTVMAFQWPSMEVFPLEVVEPLDPRGERPIVSEEIIESGLCGLPQDLLPMTCEDALGDIGSQELAIDLPEEQAGLVLCEGDEDWFRVQTGARAGALILSADDGEGGEAVYVDLLNSAQEPLAEWNADPARTWHAPLPANAEVYVRALLASGARGQYQISSWICEEDQYDNLSVQAAPRLEEGVYEGLSHCGGDLSRDSWFLVEVPGGSRLEVVLRPDLSRGDARGLAMELFSEQQAFQVRSEAVNGEVVLRSPRVSFETTYRLRVTSPRGYEAGFYDLEINTPAEPLRPNLTVENLTVGGVGVPGESISASFQVRNSGAQSAGAHRTALFLSRDAVWDQQDVQLATQTRQSQGITAVSYTLMGTIPEDFLASEAWLCAFADVQRQVTESDEEDNVACTPLTLDLQISCEDPFEPNDTRQQANLLSPGVYDDLTVCDNLDDFYRICPEPGTVVGVEISFVHDVADVDLHLIDEVTNQMLAQSVSTTDDESVNVTFQGQGCALVRVFTFIGDPNRYTMDLRYTPQEAPACEDASEPNESFGAATSFNSLSPEDARVVCGLEDYDYYYADLPAGAWTLCALHEPGAPAELLSLAVYDGQQRLVDGLSSLNPCVSFENNAGAPRRFFFEVTAGQESFTQVSYLLTLERQP